MEEVLGYIPKISDRHSLSLTSKHANNAVTPSLYHTVELCLDPEIPSWLNGFVDQKNVGRQYIRELRLHSKPTHNDVLELRIQRMIWKIVDSLPRGILTHFGDFRMDILGLDIIQLLVQTQNALERLIIPRRIEGSDKTMSKIYAIVPRLTRLHSIGLLLSLPRYDSTRFAHGFLERLPDLRELNIRNGSGEPRFKPLRELLTFSRTLRRSSKLTLSALVLACFKFNTKNISIFLSSIDLVALKSLHLLGCQGDEALLNAMAQKISATGGVGLPSLTKLKFLWFKRAYSQRGRYRRAHNQKPVGLFNLLDAFSGLRDLFIDIDGGAAPPVDCIVKHSQTLTSLLINSRPYTNRELIELCTACTELRQIGINLPETVESYPGWKALHESSSHALSLLPHLHTIRIMEYNWPLIPCHDKDSRLTSEAEQRIIDWTIASFTQLERSFAEKHRRSPVELLALAPLWRMVPADRHFLRILEGGKKLLFRHHGYSSGETPAEIIWKEDVMPNVRFLDHGEFEVYGR